MDETSRSTPAASISPRARQQAASAQFDGGVNPLCGVGSLKSGPPTDPVLADGARCASRTGRDGQNGNPSSSAARVPLEPPAVRRSS